MKEMNLPNKLTMVRIILVPVFVLFMSLPGNLKYFALFTYILASITDALDGHIARSKNMITQFGKIMDPLADKLLVSSGFVMLTACGTVPGFITAIILFRDFTVSSLRMFAVNKGGNVAAVWSGKIKTVFQLVGISVGIYALASNYTTVKMFDFIHASGAQMVVNLIFTVSILIATITTIWSLFDYFLKFRKYIDVTK